MSLSATAQTGSMLSDFSTKLLDTADIDNKLKKENNNQIYDNKLSDNKNLSDNFNLNSVLAKIRDNGSAYADSIKNDAKQVKKTQKVVKSSTTEDASRTSKSQNRDNYFNEKIVDDTLHLSSKKTVDIKLLHYISRTHLLSLVGFTVVIVGISMYMLDSHVDTSIKESVKKVSTAFPVVSHNIEEKVEGEILRTPDKILLSEIQAVDMNDQAIISSNMNYLVSEVRSLRNELEQVKNSIKINKVIEKTLLSETESSAIKLVDNKTGSSINDSISKIVSSSTSKSLNINLSNGPGAIDENTSLSKKELLLEVETGEAVPSFTVTLVSLSNKTKANEIIENLDMTGLSPQIKEVVVRDKQIYRVSVAGFKDREQATLFIKDAANKFGIKGSRVRKN